MEARPIFASQSLDYTYRLESIGVLKAWDNIDGSLSDYVELAYQRYFAQQSRFSLSNLSKVDSILIQSKLPYLKVINDRKILGQIARSSQSDSLIRTQVRKVNSDYEFLIDWIHAPYMDRLGSITFSIQDIPSHAKLSTESILEAFKAHLDELFSQVPFNGQITGREQDQVTITLSNHSNLKKGDILLIGTLDDVRKHPLVHSITEWKSSPTGQVQVESVDDGMVFGKVLEELSTHKIVRFQKILQASTPNPTTRSDSEGPLAPLVPPKTQPTLPVQEASSETNESDNKYSPKLGWVSAQLPVGFYSRQFSSTAGSINNSGSGLSLGAQVSSQIWLTRKFFADLEVGYSLWNYSQKDASTGTLSAVSQTGGASASLMNFKFDVGYSFLVRGNILGPRAWAKLGYSSHAYSLPVSTSENTGPLSIGSIFIGLGGDLPIGQTWGTLLDFNFRLFSMVSQNWLTSNVDGASDIQLVAGGYYRLNPRMRIQLLFTLQSDGADFAGGTSIGQKNITFGPSVLYYF